MPKNVPIVFGTEHRLFLESEDKMSKKKKLKRFEVLVPTHSYTEFHVEAVNEEQAIEMVLSGELSAYDIIEEEIDHDSNSYIISEVDN